VVERVWAAVADGALAREIAHDWTVPWVEGNAEPSTDAMINRAMAWLHGFDMAVSDPARPSATHHGPPGTYYRSLDEIRSLLDVWLAECVDYDADPEAWMTSRLALALAAIDEERQRGRDNP
jgi:hypothetical protein